MKDRESQIKLRQIISLAEECLRNAGSAPRKTIRINSKDLLRTKTLRDYILSLKESGYFKKAKAPREVHEKLQPTYECELKRVGVELIRLHKKKQLRKTSKITSGKKLSAYVW